MTFLYTRSLKRNRMLRRLTILSVVGTALFLYLTQSSWLEQTATDNDVQRDPRPHVSNHHWDKYHPNYRGTAHGATSGSSTNNGGEEDEQLDVTVPRGYVLDSLRKMRGSKAYNMKDSSDNRVEVPEKLQEVLHADAPVKQINTDRKPVPPAPQRPQYFQQTRQQQQQQKTMSTLTGEDSVYKLDQDDKYLPPGDGTSPDERYLSFMPHSGFHNQRIALVNALYLASRLNRTLLMPPVVLGEPIHWRKYDSLESFHRRSTKANLGYCREYLEAYYNKDESVHIPGNCVSSFGHTSLRWDRLFDMSGIKQRVRVRYRDDYDRTYLQRKYNIQHAETYHVKDELLYDYRIADKKGQSLGKYQREIFIGDLEQRKERLISFGSLFGTGRVMFTEPGSDEFRKFLYGQFVFSRHVLPSLFDEADAIIESMGGKASYVSMHARVGDSIFERFSSQVMGKLWADLQKYVALVRDTTGGSSYYGRQDTLDTATCLAPPSDRSAKAVDWDTKTIAPGRPLVIFMATDAPVPRSHPLFEQIFSTFPCVVTLSDLYDFKSSALASMVNPTDGVRYGKFLVPFLDGLIASHGQEFTGSMWSTFSSYIRFLHDKYVLQAP